MIKLTQLEEAIQQLNVGISEVNDVSEDNLQYFVELLSLYYFDAPFKHRACFNKRLKTTGGRYHLSTHELDFNKQVFKVHGLEELKKVILHELCHYHLHINGLGYRHYDRDFKELLKRTGGSRFTPPLSKKVTLPMASYRCQKCHQLYRRQRRVNLAKFACRCGGVLQERA